MLTLIHIITFTQIILLYNTLYLVDRAALQISEGIALERESLVKQLNQLR